MGMQWSHRLVMPEIVMEKEQARDAREIVDHLEASVWA